MEFRNGIFYEFNGKRSPFSRLNDALYAVQERVGAESSYLIKGVAQTDDTPSFALSTTVVKKLRYVLGTPNRKKQLNRFDSFVTCAQGEKMPMVFTTTQGNEVCFQLSDQIQNAMRSRSNACKLDALLGLTMALKEYSFWLCDNECWDVMHDGLLKLAKAWKSLLMHTDTELKIDPGSNFLIYCSS